MGGKLRLWEEAVLHVGCEALTRGLNVYEGVKGYWQDNGQFGIVMLRPTIRQVVAYSLLVELTGIRKRNYGAAHVSTCAARTRHVGRPYHTLCCRRPLGRGYSSDLVITAYHQDKRAPEPINLGVSTWRRSVDVALPARIKTGTNYPGC